MSHSLGRRYLCGMQLVRYIKIIPRSPWDRDSTHGFRLVRTFDGDEKLARLRGPREPRDRRDYRKEEPASDAEFIIYRRLYDYDSLPLNAEVVAADEFEHWIRERVAFDLSYAPLKMGSATALPLLTRKLRYPRYWSSADWWPRMLAPPQYITVSNGGLVFLGM